MIIVVLGMGAVSVEELAWVAGKLREAFPGVRVLLSPERLQPSLSWFDWGRRQYRSEQILAYVRSLKDRLGVGVLLVIAGIDAYANGLNFVFGEALLSEGVAIVYTPRLRPEFYGQPPDQRLYRQRLLKEVLHEVGHALGLEHCTVPGCVMNFSNSVVDVDGKAAAYCEQCARRLAVKGIKVSRAYVLRAER